jgi:hypothetical protein
MRNIVFLACVVFAASASRAAEDDCGCFTPTAEQIADLETRITDLPAPVYDYARYYSGWAVTATVNGRTVIRRYVQGQYLPLRGDAEAGIHIVEGRRLPPPKTEGCIANYDVPLLSDAFEIYARCNRPEGWTPDAAGIVALETRLALPPGAAPLARYARHYAGITESGVHLIQGIFVSAAGAVPGVVIESEVELPVIAGTGCDMIEVQFNPETALGSAHCGRAE